MSDEREPLGAYVDPYVAAVIERQGSQLLRKLEAYGQRMILGGRERHGREVLASISRLRNSAIGYREAYEAVRASASVGGSPEVPSAGDESRSGCFVLLGGDQSVGGGVNPSPTGSEIESRLLTSREVAAVLQIGDRGARDLIFRGSLRGTKAGRRWLVDPDDLAAYVEERNRRTA